MAGMTAPAIHWFRQDLRLTDNDALTAASAAGPVLPVYVLDEDAADSWVPGAASRWWLHHSLMNLGTVLAARGTRFLLLRGDACEALPALAEQIGATEIHAARLYEPRARRRDAQVHEALRIAGRKLVLHAGALLHEPHRLRSGAGGHYSVYTPFSRAVFAAGDPPAPIAAPARLLPVQDAPDGLALDALELLPRPDWAVDFPKHWTPGEAGAQARLRDFAAQGLLDYAARRNAPAVEWGTSGLSPHLHFGEISPRQIWHVALHAAGGERERIETFLKEILWREFAHHLLWHRPEMPETPLRQTFASFPWQPDPALLRTWQRGRTGFPIVDAGMRQLWRTGWMHNRVRMIVASVLTKHFLQPWQDGAAWFWDTLVDADLAANSASWQWVAGCGADAAPYFRVFNPVLQGEKFDPDGVYVRRWCPELARLPDRWLHRPWEAPEAVLAEARLRIGHDYPAPAIGLAEGRARALAAYATLKDAT